MIDGLVWRANPSTVKRVVIPAVLELFLDATADLKMETRRHGHITELEGGPQRPDSITTLTRSKPTIPTAIPTKIFSSIIADEAKITTIAGEARPTVTC